MTRTRSAASEGEAYDRFAPLYDSFMDDVDYGAWARHYLSVAGVVEPIAICECGCGTGSMSVRWLEAGHRVIGVDRSARMLSVAAEKARGRCLRLELACQDIRELELHKPVDAIFAPCDVLNYIKDLGSLSRFFASARAFLKPGGVLAFDLSTRFKFESELGGQAFFDDRDEATCLWHNAWDGAKGELTMRLTVFERERDGYSRFDERHVQYSRSEGEIRSGLAGAGFTNVRAYGDFSLDPPKRDSLRVHYVAAKPFLLRQVCFNDRHRRR